LAGQKLLVSEPSPFLEINYIAFNFQKRVLQSGKKIYTDTIFIHRLCSGSRFRKNGPEPLATRRPKAEFWHKYCPWRSPVPRTPNTARAHPVPLRCTISIYQQPFRELGLNEICSCLRPSLVGAAWIGQRWCLGQPCQHQF